MNAPDWQIVATVACVVFAAIVVVRRIVRLFNANQSHGCGTGACTSCPTQKSVTSNVSGDFIPLDSFVDSSHKRN